MKCGENENLIEREPVQNTPFWIIGNKEEGYFLTMGKWRLTDKLTTMDEVEAYLDEHSYEIVMKMIICLQSANEEEEAKVIDINSQIKTKKMPLKPKKYATIL